MNLSEKTKFDVMVHLTDIPMLGKQYVPGLWKQIEGGNGAAPSERTTNSRGGGANPSNLAPTENAQENKGNEKARTQIGAFCQPIEKRALPPTANNSSADSSLAAPLSKIPRLEW